MGYSQRLESVRARLDAAGIGGALYFSYENRRYLTGFTGSNGQVWVTKDKVVLLTDGRYRAQAVAEATADDVIVYQQLGERLPAVVGGAAGTMGFEGTGISVAEWARLAEKAGLVDWRPLPATCEDIRVIKDDGELACIRAAIDVAENGYRDVIGGLKTGVVERDFSLQLEWRIRQRGAHRIPFDFIVASGERSALPHGVAGSRILASGDAVTLDFGAEHSGYFSDMTFAGSVGERNAWIEEIIGILQEARQAALRVCTPGAPVAEVDAAARRVIEAASYGDAFSHSLGHGVGLAIHEAPKVSALSKELLCEGTVVTIEPGIYVAGRGGARIEDMVRVGATQPEILTTIPKRYEIWS